MQSLREQMSDQLESGTPVIEILPRVPAVLLVGTSKGKITVGYANRPDEIEFYVRDTGKGIDEKHQSKIFERFVKVQGNHNENSQGTGLGLPISKGIIEVLGGRIWVESKLNVGTTFFFTVPTKNLSEGASLN
jgi:signal transduction histidine kinase